ncbi:HlyD family efflux transporter periplasmic adaptor subunit [Cyanobium sp. T1G-Tous]|uniref:HlyD family secretion protein n=1 Tax=unclassified Cyanobium TaxID=2627006 RepID=UPI0020CEA806|nr:MULTISPECIES: HlyD family efflux transporter periplasmic adaptor subunit [unclassified Cyanobium]MCP9776580.1 HlyD family efflux transporter periplasmic adaptor subunit [Cyanobium sp. Tous-M-B4]MCP9802227.1 HlyD family efflux transporter periplasmic adaptor subunit [Cyanobium sp. T1G-Tous]MCP9876747.1 HlyD family efflux transporter periplasmic adaptor subunit [Cyanobium sp. A2C-AMD]
MSIVRRAQNAIERRVQTSHEEMALQQSRFLARAITWALVGTTAAGLAWLAFAKTDEVVVASGKLQPIGDVKTIQMPVGGVLETMLVKDGQRVTKGQVLLRLDNEATLDRQGSLRTTIIAKQAQLRLKEVELARYLNLNDTEQTVTRQNLVLETEILQRLEVLKAVGASAELQYLQQRNKVREVDGELAKLKVDRLRQIAIIEQALEQIKGELADLGSKLTELQVNIRYQDVRSPVDGVVFDLKPTGPGFVAQGSEPVMKIVPFDALQAKVEIESSDIGFVRVGRPADISIDSFPATDFGVLLGTVKGIGSDALPPDERNQTYRFPATIALDSQQLKLKSGKSLPLQVGMSLTANIKLRKVTYLQLLLGEFKDKTDSLKQI